jgi:hypothetical protein
MIVWGSDRCEAQNKKRDTQKEQAKDLKPAGYVAEWLATAGVAAVLALPFPCAAAQQNANHAPGQRNQAPQRQPNRQQQAPRQPQGPGQQPGHAGDWLRRYKDMPAGEQERALQNDPQFRRLPPQNQEQLRQRLQHFSTLPPQQQQRMLNRMETWEHLTPDQKQQAREVFGQMQQLPPDRRRMVGTAVRDLRSMPPAQREQVINSDRFKSMFSSQERDMLRGATRLPLAPTENGEQSGPQQ